MCEKGQSLGGGHIVILNKITISSKTGSWLLRFLQYTNTFTVILTLIETIDLEQCG